jgi:hypothetical protein
MLHRVCSFAEDDLWLLLHDRRSGLSVGGPGKIPDSYAAN